MSEAPSIWTAVILAGGKSRRLGEDKSKATIAGRSLLDHVTEAIPTDVMCIVVGPPPATAERLLVVAIEDQPDGGPVAGLECGIEFVMTPVVVLLAVDMPFAGAIAPRLVAAIESAEGSIDAVVPVDGTGRRQPLAAAYRTGPLREALATLAPVRGRSMRALLDHLKILELTIDDSPSHALLDIDTPDDLEEARRTVAGVDRATDGTVPQ